MVGAPGIWTLSIVSPLTSLPIPSPPTSTTGLGTASVGIPSVGLISLESILVIGDTISLDKNSCIGDGGRGTPKPSCGCFVSNCASFVVVSFVSFVVSTCGVYIDGDVLIPSSILSDEYLLFLWVFICSVTSPYLGFLEIPSIIASELYPCFLNSSIWSTSSLVTGIISPVIIIYYNSNHYILHKC